MGKRFLFVNLDKRVKLLVLNYFKNSLRLNNKEIKKKRKNKMSLRK